METQPGSYGPRNLQIVHKNHTSTGRATLASACLGYPKQQRALPGTTSDPSACPIRRIRILDGALSSLVVAHCSQHLHPSQSMLNHFREPQKAVLSIQQELDSTGPKAALFIDMAKAFEKSQPTLGG